MRSGCDKDISARTVLLAIGLVDEMLAQMEQ
jgi:hypothetical protein